MAAARKPASAPSRRGADDTRERLVEAAFDTLCEEGFAGASARAIATRGDINQALVFYHFGSVNGLLYEVLARSSRAQLDRYQEALDGVTSLSDLFSVVGARFEEDLASGHVKVLTELIGGSGTDPELKERIRTLIDPWLELTEASLSTLLGPLGLEASVPGEQAAFVVMSLFLGMQMMVSLTGTSEPAIGAFAAGSQLAGIFDGLFGMSGAR